MNSRVLAGGSAAGGFVLVAIGLAMSIMQVHTPSEVMAAPPDIEFEPFSDQACLDCHTDRALLDELAVEEAAAEPLSDGPG